VGGNRSERVPPGPQAATRCPAAHPTARPRLRRASIPGSLSLSLSHSTRSPLLPATRHPTPANIPRKRARRPALRSSAACLPAHVRAASRRPLAPPVSSTTSPLLRLEGGAAAWSCTSRAPPCRAQWRTARKGGWPSAARLVQLAQLRRILRRDDERNDEAVEAERGAETPDEDHANVQLRLAARVLHTAVAAHADR